jgi:hypothetical protein
MAFRKPINPKARGTAADQFYNEANRPRGGRKQRRGHKKTRY